MKKEIFNQQAVWMIKKIRDKMEDFHNKHDIMPNAILIGPHARKVLKKAWGLRSVSDVAGDILSMKIIFVTQDMIKPCFINEK